jgi:uncharacterized protein
VSTTEHRNPPDRDPGREDGPAHASEPLQDGRKANRLATEASPYLLQHAHNPVEWWPWGEDALAEAKRRDAPILLSIGYSACHWCHVMERESFEDEEIARVMNELFVNIKVDREERPDLDQIYQLVVQLMGRSGGWPLTVFLTPSQKPFYAGTYFPPEDRHGMPGFPKLLRALADAYHERRDEVLGQADELTRAIVEVSRGSSDGTAPYTPGPDLLERASRLLLRRFDEKNGGLGSAPKFPNTMPLEVLLRRGVLEKDGPSADAARVQLEAMRKGGIWDHLGGGFHRYSTDERWLVPHFEKMLYDNALLLRSYIDGYRAFSEPLFAQTARAIAAYVEREMTDAEGGYYASQDADSEGAEGKFFIWDEAEVKDAVASDALARVAIEYFGVTLAGNFEDHGRPTFKTVLHESRPIRSVAAKLGLSEQAARDELEQASKRMFAAREKREKPFRDEKVLTSWSALMIGAMAEAGAALGDDALVRSAERALAFVEAKLVVRDGAGASGAASEPVRVARLCKKVVSQAGVGGAHWVVKSPGFLDDHAYLANAALDVYEATGDPAKVRLARGLAEAIVGSFAASGASAEGEGFFFAPRDGEALITRSKESYDNAVPSGAAMACRALLRLGALGSASPEANRYADLAEAELARLAGPAVANPFGYGQTLCELDRVVRGSVDVVLVGPRTDPRTRALARAVFAKWLPNRTIAWLDPSDESSREACPTLAEGKVARPEPAAYVCRGRSCSLPVTTPEELLALLG